MIFANTNFKPLLGLRYLDNIFRIWKEGLERLQEFYQYLKSFQPTIKFTMELAKEQINFLDVNISQREGALQKLSEKCPNTELFLVRIFLYSE